MADVGSSLEVSDMSRSEMGSQLSDCPICLEQLHQPKSLPCLHSFCQECLSTFITKDLSGKMPSATTFPCPVCRKMTQPDNPSEDKEKWAQQFPTNDLIEDLVKVTEREPIYCKPFEKKGNTGTPATIWCKTCNVLCCDGCKLECHDLIHEGCETVTEVGKFCIKCPSDTTDCHAPGVVYLPDDHIVIGDFYNNKIKLFTASGKCEDELKLQGTPNDMCRVDDHTVVVANTDAPVIYVIKVESSKLTLTSEIKLSNGKSPWGVTYTGNGFIVSSRKELYTTQQDGNTDHVQTNPFKCYHLAYDPRRQHIYGTQFTSDRGAVAVYRLSGTRIDIATVGVLQNALGIDVDDKGNVYVCGRESNNVVQMSEDGANVRELLTSSDGVARPRAISLCGNRFVLTNESPGNGNYVHVFELN